MTDTTKRMSDADTTKIFRELRALKASLEPKINKEDLVITLITVCIEAELNTGVRIVRALKHIGLNGDHVAIVLKGRTGNRPGDWWSKDARGIYSVCPGAGAIERTPVPTL